MNIIARLLVWLGIMLALEQGLAQPFTDNVLQFVVVQDSKIALVDATVIDGTGQMAKRNHTVLITDGVLTAIGPNDSVAPDPDARVIDCQGQTLIPGFVMLHEHMFYSKPFEGTFSVGQMSFTFPRLYLAGGCTTIRTGGSIQPTSDLMIKKWVDSGKMAGPNIDVTGPFITSTDIGILELSGLDESDLSADEMVNYWADKGATSFKVYTSITREDLKKVVETAHTRGLKVTGHLCSVTYREAAEIGIDNLEHGFFASSDFDKNKHPDECDPFALQSSLAALDVNSTEMRELMEFLIRNEVAVTSTLPVFEPYRNREIVPGGGLEALTPEIRNQVTTTYRRRLATQAQPTADEYFKKHMAWEKQFYDMGGLLVAGTDPTGAGRVVPGYSNQRVIELLVEAGFKIEVALKIATLNGATYLNMQRDIGSLAVGKMADLIVIDGDLTQDVSKIRQMSTVFKRGIGYSSPKLFGSVKGKVGLY